MQRNIIISMKTLDTPISMFEINFPDLNWLMVTQFPNTPNIQSSHLVFSTRSHLVYVENDMYIGITVDRNCGAYCYW